MEFTQKELSYSNEVAYTIYLEIAAHLEQVSGVNVEILPAINTTFAYHQSQVRGILIKYTAQLNQKQQELIESILAYYAALYGTYKIS